MYLLLQTVNEAVNISMEFGEIAGNDSAATVVPGEVRKIILKAEIPEESIYDLEFSFLIPQASTRKLEICDAVIEDVGDNLPCVDKLMNPTLTSRYVQMHRHS